MWPLGIAARPLVPGFVVAEFLPLIVAVMVSGVLVDVIFGFLACFFTEICNQAEAGESVARVWIPDLLGERGSEAASA